MKAAWFLFQEKIRIKLLSLKMKKGTRRGGLLWAAVHVIIMSFSHALSYVMPYHICVPPGYKSALMHSHITRANNVSGILSPSTTRIRAFLVAAIIYQENAVLVFILNFMCFSSDAILKVSCLKAGEIPVTYNQEKL